MHTRNRILTGGVVTLCLALTFNVAATAANNSASSDTSSSASTSSLASVSASHNSRPNVMISGPGGRVVIDGSNVQVTAGNASEAPEPPQPPESPSPPWQPSELGEAGGNAVVSIGHDSNLAADAHADSVVSVFGSSHAEGDVTHTVVSIFGDTTANGKVGDAAVAVFGNTIVNNEVRGDVVAVLGDVNLGPEAKVGGHVVAVGGTVARDPAAEVRGGVQNVGFGPRGFSLNWLRPWINNCLIYGRLLAFAPGLGWAWTLAFVSLLFYVFTAMLFREATERCLQTLDAHPGHSILAALLVSFGAPIAMVLLAVTVIGLLVIPFVGAALLVIESFGKMVMLAWIGRRLTRSPSEGVLSHPAAAVLIGGVLVTLLYCVPVLGFITYKLLGFVGLGAVVYALILQMRSRREARAAKPANNDRVAAEPVISATAEMQPNVEIDRSSPHATNEKASAETIEPSISASTAAAALVYPRAGFGMRMAALLLDVILIGVVLNFAVDSQRLHLITLAAYGAVMWKLKGTTIGGIVFNLKVVRLDGREIDWATAIVRALSCFLSLFIFALGFIWIAFDDEKQSWHDKIAGTVVVRLPKGVSLL